jgi:hypothetical protein
MIGLVLALVVLAIVVVLLGGWIFGLVIGVAAIVLFALFLAGWGRRTTTRRPDAPA